VGTILKNDFALKNDVLAIDGITLHDFDFIDLGKALEPSGTVPVTIKSLVFHL
jgi:ethanolamine utilization protein EutA